MTVDTLGVVYVKLTHTWDSLSLHYGRPSLIPIRLCIPLPTVDPRSRPAVLSIRRIFDGITRRLEIARPTPSPPVLGPPSVHPVLAHGLIYDPNTNPGSFRTPNNQPIAAAILDEAAAPAHPGRTAALTFIGTGAESFIRCPAGRDVVAVRDVLDAIEAALQGPAFARPTEVVRILVQSPSVGDFRILLSLYNLLVSSV